MAQDIALQEVERLIADQHKIRAIKALRERSGLGLRDAKEGVEFFAKHGHWRPTDVEAVMRVQLRSPAGRAEREAFAQAVLGDSSLLARGAAELEPAQGSGVSAAQRAELLALLRDGRKIEAIKRFRKEFPVSLAQAKNAVEALAQGTPPERVRVAPEVATAPTHAVPLPEARSAAVARPSAEIRPVAEPDGDPRQVAAQSVFSERYRERPLACVAAECGLFKGFVLVSDERVAFVADRYGSWEVTEDLRRAELESVAVRQDPFGFELELQSGIHNARFSELDGGRARGLERLLSGQAAAYEPEPESPRATAPQSAPFASLQPVDVQPHGATNPVPLAAAVASSARLPMPRLRFGSATVARAFVAGVPLALFGSVGWFIPMSDFPSVANSVLYWAALALGAALRGRAVLMLRFAFAVGMLAWAASDLLGQGYLAHVAAVCALGAVYGQARGRLLFGAMLGLPILLCDWLSTLVLPQFGPVLLLGVIFWLFQFAAEDGEENAPGAAPNRAR